MNQTFPAVAMPVKNLKLWESNKLLKLPKVKKPSDESAVLKPMEPSRVKWGNRSALAIPS